MKHYIAEIEGMELVGYVDGPEVRDAKRFVVYTGPRPLNYAMEHLPPGYVQVNEATYVVDTVSKIMPPRQFIGEGLPLIEGEGRDYALIYVAPQPSVQRWDNFEFRTGNVAAVGSYDTQEPDCTYRLDMWGCTIDGMHDHVSGSGRVGKWGRIPHRWAGFMKDCVVHNIAKEHGDYLHSITGDCHYDDCLFDECGRNGIQHVGRQHESGFAPHRLTVTDCTFRDCGLDSGGFSLTAQGMKELVVRRTKILAGYDTELRDGLMARGKKMNTGGIVNWSEKSQHTPNENLPSDGILLDEVGVSIADGCGTMPAVSITNAKRLLATGRLALSPGSALSPAMEVGSSIELIPMLEDAEFGGEGIRTIDIAP